MYQRRHVERGEERVVRPAMRAYRRSPAALFAAIALATAYVVVAVLREHNRLTRMDLRIVAHVVPVRYHPRFLATLHPLVHLGDALFVAPLILLVMCLLWLAGYRRCWALLVGLLSWPLELASKAILTQPQSAAADGQGAYLQEQFQLGDLLHGSGTQQTLAWFSHAAPGLLGALVRHAGNATIDLTSSYPSGTTARGAFAIGMLIWLALRLDVLVLSELLVLALAAPLGVLGLSVVLFAWHWPSDVIGGYLLGFALLAAALAVIQRPIEEDEVPVAPPVAAPTRHGQRRLPWVPNR